MRGNLNHDGMARLDEAYDTFLKSKKANGVTTKAINNYDFSYQLFLEYLLNSDEYKNEATDKSGISRIVKCADITPDTITDFTVYLRETKPKLRDISLQTYLRNVRTVLYYFMDRNFMPRFKVETTKAEKRIKETYTDWELGLLLEKPNLKYCTFSELRNWAIINYLLATGNRARTICNIKIEDLDLDNSEVMLKAVKNKKPYIMPLSEELIEVLKLYLRYRKGEAQDYLFCNAHGNELAPEGLDSAIERYNHSRGVTKTSIHLFRHTFAKKWILNGGDPHRLKKYLGHSSMAMVEEYVNMYGADLHVGFNDFNPLDKLLKEKNAGKKKYQGNAIKMRL